jgi:hypothetical protein
VHRTYHREGERAFEDHAAIQTTDFDFDGMDARLGWTERGDCEPKSDSQQLPPSPPLNATVDEEFDPDTVPIPPQQEGIIKLICLLLASDHCRLELLTLAAAFGLSTLLGGKSFSAMAQESGCTKQAFSRRVIRLQHAFNLPVTLAQKSVAARASYSKSQREVWKRPERQADNDLRLAHRFAEPVSYVNPARRLTSLPSGK